MGKYLPSTGRTLNLLQRNHSHDTLVTSIGQIERNGIDPEKGLHEGPRSDLWGSEVGPIERLPGCHEETSTTNRSHEMHEFYEESIPAMKRIFDILLSGVGLIAVAIKPGGGPIFYSQERVGKDGRRFKSWKFRSMVPVSDHRYGPLQAGQDDQRITGIGRIVRATAMDELPQLWSIFVGDMSFVGPRALMPNEIEVQGPNNEAVAIEEILGYWERHRVRSGLTGIAQVYADRDIPRRHKFKYDLLYVKQQSFWLDLRLIALSLFGLHFDATESIGERRSEHSPQRR